MRSTVLREPDGIRRRRSSRPECVRHIIPLGERHLRGALRDFLDHCHVERKHEGLGNVIRFPSRDSASPVGRICRRERLAGVLCIYDAKRRVNPS